MGFLRDLINGHEAFFEDVEAKRKETNEAQKSKLILLDDAQDEEVKAA